MPVLQSDLQALDAAIATGERLVRKSDGTTVEYRSIAELIAAKDELTRQKNADDAAAASSPPRPRVTRLYHGGRGF